MLFNFTKAGLLLVLGLCSTLNVLAQSSFQVSGKVVAKVDGFPLPGVTVVVKGNPSLGAVTDLEGNYVITLPDGEQDLTFNFVGYKSQTIPVLDRKVINVSLRDDVELLGEVLITGYKEMEEIDITGNIETIQSKDISDNSAQNFQTALQGLATGVDVNSSGGSVGGPTFIRIRGVGSFSSNSEPLYVIDGVPISSYPPNGTANFGTTYSPLSTIDPNNIESVSILKDAQASAQYGSRGANGVIIITTKSGKKGQAQFNFNYSYGISEPTNLVEMLGTRDYIEMYKEARRNSGDTTSNTFPHFPWIRPFHQNIVVDNSVDYPTFGTRADGGVDSTTVRLRDDNKYDRVYRVGVEQRASLSVQGGSEKTTYYVNTSYLNSQGILEQNDKERVNAITKITFKPVEKLKVGVSVDLSFDENTFFPTNIFFISNVRGSGSPFEFFNQPVGLNFIENSLPFYPDRELDGTYWNTNSLANPIPTLDPNIY